MADEENYQPLRTKLPTETDKEDAFLVLGEFEFSLRQMLTVFMAGGVFAVLMMITSSLFGLPQIFAALLWSWILIGGIVMAFVKKDGLTYEEYLTRKLTYLMSERNFILKSQHGEAGIEDADWDDIDDLRF